MCTGEGVAPSAQFVDSALRLRTAGSGAHTLSYALHCTALVTVHNDYTAARLHTNDKSHRGLTTTLCLCSYHVHSYIYNPGELNVQQPW